jgi:hypothetical protein
VEDISILGYDNEDQYMEDDKHNNKHQLMINQNIHHHFDKVAIYVTGVVSIWY